MHAVRSLYPGSAPKKDAPPELVLIHYPGIIKNVDKALETLGGMSSISQSFFSNRPLELRHTPANPFTSCLSAERKNEAKVTSGTLHVAIRVRRRKKNPSVVEAQCLGLVNTLYRFESLCDFQYLPIRGLASDSEKFEDLMPRLIPEDLPSALCWWDKPDATSDETPLFLPPYQFSRYTTPSNKILCRDTVFGEKTRKKALGHGHNLRVERKALSLNVHSNDDFPAAPSEEAVKDADNRCKNDKPHKQLEELFKERPLWTRVAVSYKTGLDDTILKSLLQKFAFYITNGPWGRLWCRFGFDPRKEPSAVHFQTLMVSFRQHTKIPERQRLKVSSSERPRLEEEPINEAVNFQYHAGKLPRVRQMWYCLCDIALPDAQEVVRKNITTEYNPTTGYVNVATLDIVRAQIKEDVKRTSSEMEVEESENADVSMDDEWR